MAVIANDGSVQYGSRTVQIPVTTGDTFVADNIEVTRATKIIEQTDEIDEPSGQVVVADFVTGNMTIQALASTAPPQLGETFSDTFDSDVGAETFYVTEVSQVEDKGSEKKYNVQFRKKYN